MTNVFNAPVEIPVVSGNTIDPLAGHVSIYAKTDGNIYKKSGSTETLLVPDSSGMTSNTGDNIDKNTFNDNLAPYITSSITYYINTDLVSSGDGSIGSPFNTFLAFSEFIKNFTIPKWVTVTVSCSGSVALDFDEISQRNISKTRFQTTPKNNAGDTSLHITGVGVTSGLTFMSGATVDTNYSHKWILSGTTNFATTEGYYRSKFVYNTTTSQYFPIGFSGNDGTNNYIFAPLATFNQTAVYSMMPATIPFNGTQFQISFGENSKHIKISRFSFDAPSNGGMATCHSTGNGCNFTECYFGVKSNSYEVVAASTSNIFVRCSFSHNLNINIPNKSIAGNTQLTSCVMMSVNTQTCKDLLMDGNIISMNSVSGAPSTAFLKLSSVVNLQNTNTIVYPSTPVPCPSVIAGSNAGGVVSLNTVIQKLQVYTGGSNKITNVIGINPILTNDNVRLPYNITFKSEILGMNNITNVVIPTFTFTGTVFTGSTIATALSNTALYEGQSISATGLPSGTVVNIIDKSGLTMIMSNSATTTGTTTFTATIDSRLGSSMKYGSYLYINGVDFSWGRNTPITIPTVRTVGLSCGSNQAFILCEETGKIYNYVVSGSSYAVDNVNYLNTKDGGNSRYVTLSTPPGGSTTQVQFNDGGVLAGDSSLVWDKTNDRLGVKTTPVSSLDVNGSVSYAVIVVTGNTTLDESHHTIIQNSTTGLTHTLPTASACTNREYTFSNSGTGTLTVNGVTLNQGQPELTVLSDGVNWINSYNPSVMDVSGKANISGSNITPATFNDNLHPMIVTATTMYLNTDAGVNGDGTVGSPFNTFELFTEAIKFKRITAEGSITLTCTGSTSVLITKVSQKNLAGMIIDNFNRLTQTDCKIIIVGNHTQFETVSLTTSVKDGTYTGSKWNITASTNFNTATNYYRFKAVEVSTGVFYPVGASGFDGVNNYLFVAGGNSSIQSGAKIYTRSQMTFETCNSAGLKQELSFGENSGNIVIRNFDITVPTNLSDKTLYLTPSTTNGIVFDYCGFVIASTYEISSGAANQIFNGCAVNASINFLVRGTKTRLSTARVSICVMVSFKMQSCNNLIFQGGNIFTYFTGDTLSDASVFKLAGQVTAAGAMTVVYTPTITSLFNSSATSSGSETRAFIRELQIYSQSTNKVTNFIGNQPIPAADDINPYSITIKSAVVGYSNVTNISVATSQRDVSNPRYMGYLSIGGQDYSWGMNSPITIETVSKVGTDCGSNQKFVLCEETGGAYKYVVSGSSYTIDNVSVLATKDGGSSRYVTITPSTVNTSIIYVDANNGSDSLGGYSNPFQTLNAARDFAPSGTTIHVLAGSYAPTNILSKNGVNWNFDGFPVITPTDSCPYLFVVSDSIVGHNVADYTTGFKVTGNAIIVLNPTSSCQPIILTNPNFNIEIEFNLLDSRHLTTEPVVIIGNTGYFIRMSGDIKTRYRGLKIQGSSDLYLTGNFCRGVDASGVTDMSLVPLDLSQSMQYSYEIKYSYLSRTTIYTYGLAAGAGLIQCGYIGVMTMQSYYGQTGIYSTIGALTYTGAESRDHICGEITTLNISGGYLNVTGNIVILNQTSGVLRLSGQVTDTFTKSGGHFYGSRSSAYYNTVDDYRAANIDSKVIVGSSTISPVAKLNTAGSTNLHPFSSYNSSDAEIFGILNTAIVKMKETATEPSLISGFIQYWVNTYGKMLSLNDDNTKSWLNSIIDHTPSTGDILTYNGTTGYSGTMSTEFDLIIKSYDVNVSSDSLLTTTVPAGYKIYSVLISETSSNSAGIVKIGTAASGYDVVSPVSVSAGSDIELLLSKQYFSRTTDTSLYISSTAWGSGSINLYFTLIKVI